jgi:hypothetical protein
MAKLPEIRQFGPIARLLLPTKTDEIRACSIAVRRW